MHIKIIRFLATVVSIFTLLATGCTAVKTFPNAARPGETVSLAVGSPDNLTISTINNVQFVSDAAPGSPVDITANVRSVFRLYADKTSRIYTDGSSSGTGTGEIVRTSAHEPWISVVVIDMPEELKPKYQYFTEAKIDKLRDIGYDREFHSLEEGILKYVYKLDDDNR